MGHAIILAHVVSMATFKGIPGVEAAGVLATIAGTSVMFDSSGANSIDPGLALIGAKYVALGAPRN